MKLKKFCNLLLLSTTIAAICSCNSKKEENTDRETATINKEESTQPMEEADTLNYVALAMRYSLLNDDAFESFQKDILAVFDSAYADFSRNVNRETKNLYMYWEQNNKEAARECANAIDVLYKDMAGTMNELLLCNAYYRIECHRIILDFLDRQPVWNTEWIRAWAEEDESFNVAY